MDFGEWIYIRMKRVLIIINVDEKLVNLLLPDDTLGVPSLFKIMPQLLVELIGSSAREGYQECILLYNH